MNHLLMVLVLLWSSGLQAEDKHQPTGSQCESTAKADIVLLVCESKSITSEDYENIKSFLTQIVNNFNIGPDKVQIGLVQYSSNPRTEWYLNTHQTKQSLLEAIAKLHQRGGGTNTGRALKYLVHVLFKPSVGMRADSQKIVVLITDGESEDNVFSTSQHLRDTDVEIYTIGIKNANETQLRTVASDPKEIHMFSVIDSSFLLDIIDNLTNNLCNSINNLETVRLVGGASRCAGTLEMNQGEWRPVYGSHWTLKEAAVVCRELDCGSAVSTGSRKKPYRRSVWRIRSDCLQFGSALRGCAFPDSSSSTVELTCSDLLVQPIISVSSTMDGVSEVQQQGFLVRRGSNFTISCSVQPQYPGGSFQLTFTSSNKAHIYTQPAVNHSADFLFPAADPAHQGNYSCVYGVYVFSHNFSSESRLLSLTVTGQQGAEVRPTGEH
ncbi:cartilage matrix protein-like isoform X2 [Thunnus maccoyii]|uniref:cartilage matrix protein-like isoform X2 n=1 Tax=Thunnus maccoyii TaxID=8240 RepID=UPI001C4D9787|nr:cartilage matrix protein-like isoform X2 [Thunnus maccoyii]